MAETSLHNRDGTRPAFELEREKSLRDVLRTATTVCAFAALGCASAPPAFGPAPTTFSTNARKLCASHAGIGVAEHNDANPGGHLGVVFENQTSSAFRLVALRIELDGVRLCEAAVDPDDAPTAIPIGYGSVAAGEHAVSVALELRGHGEGVFSYLRKYRFEVRGSHKLSMTEGQRKRLRVILFERGGVTTPLEQRPALEFIEEPWLAFGQQSRTYAPFVKEPPGDEPLPFEKSLVGPCIFFLPADT